MYFKFNSSLFRNVLFLGHSVRLGEFIVLILNPFQTTAAEMSGPSRPGISWTPNVMIMWSSSSDLIHLMMILTTLILHNRSSWWTTIQCQHWPTWWGCSPQHLLTSPLCALRSPFFIFPSQKLLASIRCFVRRAFPFPFLIFNVSNVIIDLLASTPCRLHCFLLEFSIF